MTWRQRLGKRLVLGIALLGLVLGGCGGGSDEDDEATQPSGGTVEGDTITVVMTDNTFAPNKITVPVGKQVTFVAKNEGAIVHNMKILSKAAEGKDYASDPLVNPNAESKFTVTFKKTGTLKFQCDYHLPGMIGTIEVK